MAQALEALYPGVKFGIGPAVENGFYYDVDLGGRTLTEADLAAIEKKMIEFAKTKESFECRMVPKEEALKTFKEKGDEYKVELISELEDGKIRDFPCGYAKYRAIKEHEAAQRVQQPKKKEKAYKTLLVKLGLSKKITIKSVP